MMRYRIAWIIAILSICILPTVAQNNLSIQVIDEPIFDRDANTVTLDVVVRGESNFELTDLAPINFDIGEPSSSVSVTAQRRLPIAIAMIIDLSVGSDDDLIRDALRSFFRNYYLPEDDVTLYILDGEDNTPRVVTIDSLATANEVIDNLDQQQPFYHITNSIRMALDNLIAKGASPLRPRVGLYISSLITKPSEITASIGFAREGIPFHVIQTHRLRNQQAPLFRRLAENGGGLFSNNQSGLFVLTDGDYQPVNTLKVLFDTIDNSRLVYTLSYTTLNQNLSEIQAVPLTLKLNEQLTAMTNFSYTRTFDAPEIAFANIADLTVSRVPFRDDDGQIGYSRNTQSIGVTIAYPDGVTRAISSMRLEIIDAGTENILQSTLSSDLTQSADGTYNLVWNLDGFSIPNTTTDLRIKVIAFDELGLTASTERDAQVIVASAPPLPTPTLVPTAIPTEIPTEIPEVVEPTPLLAPPVTASTSNNVTSQSLADNSANTLLIIAILVLILVTIILLLRVIRFRREGVQIVQYNAEGEIISMPMNRGDIIPNNLDDMPTPTPDELDAMADMDSSVVLAQLIVTQGFDSAIFENRVINITSAEFLVGRSEDSECDLVINVPYVSPHHCVIMVDENQQYRVRDLSSKNGTFVNDERIPDDEIMPAPIGSEISITKSITMEIWDANTVLDTSRFDRDGDGDDDAYDLHQDAEFQPLPGLKYVEDDGREIGNDYEPI